MQELVIPFMKLDILICTYNERIAQVPAMLLPFRPDISYIVSMQYTEKRFLRQIPEELQTRRDVKLLFLEGIGLSRNRNHALQAATADVALIADDDCRYTADYFDRILSVFEAHPEVDIAQFMLHTATHDPIKPYPSRACPYENRPKGLYPSSMELAFRVGRLKNRILFNEHFGLGTKILICGEEEVWLHDASQAGFSVWFFPYYIVDAPYESTGKRAYTDKGVMRAKGAVNYHLFGASAWLRMVKFALIGACQHKASFFLLLFQSWYGIIYYLKHCRTHENTVVGRSE